MNSYKLLILLFLSLMAYSSFAVAPPRTTRTTKQGGDWEVAANWLPGAVPDFDQTDNTDDIVIDIPSVNGSITLNKNFHLKAGTTLLVAGCDTLIINGDAVFSNGSFLTVEPCAVMIITGDLQNKNNSDDIEINGGLTVGGDFNGGNGSVIAGTGDVDVIGTITLDGTGTITANVLPIELLQFTATFNESKVDLYWTTVSEINNEIFIVEKSKDGFEWQTAAFLPGAGNSTTIIDYFDQDLDPFQGVSYYRLKQVDYDGREETFNVVAVENISNGKVAFHIFPNPTTQGNINLSFEGFENEEILVVVRDVQGKEYYSKVTIVENEKEIQLLSVDHLLAPGIYLVTASSLNSLYSQKVIIK
jgi:hypothetical protein